MINDINLAGVFFPALLVIAFAALLCAMLLVSFLNLSKLYRRLPLRPLVDFTTYILTFFLLMQGVNALGLIL
ncbi:MAG: DUF1656 domain-containing protein [Ewingella americana]|jgi:hypothetical protein|uniref:DUF1656 domain-containing protein n=1 Tax=Ewingella americana TaxID=41202 RepID=UPI00242E3FB0|nr:DUF1656 domain-containing protein [Ewingella americana]MCI1678239.1 DUF1656 domain-containing protein [Ewingella americana]MCI1856124.1 DUF1656 domain-containing protein [Ewingella americana]MCI1862349.1 DUF1656 domain-containing protein [Ewingella americana]MCI2143784.1 DUF1656 domain-containing protein [Ewingella americana]MCI2162489.1 DUF1656 domain-containing protein [Ewingella americana]